MDDGISRRYCDVNGLKFMRAKGALAMLLAFIALTCTPPAMAEEHAPDGAPKPDASAVHEATLLQ